MRKTGEAALSQEELDAWAERGFRKTESPGRSKESLAPPEEPGAPEDHTPHSRRGSHHLHVKEAVMPGTRATGTGNRHSVVQLHADAAAVDGASAGSPSSRASPHSSKEPAAPGAPPAAAAGRRASPRRRTPPTRSAAVSSSQRPGRPTRATSRSSIGQSPSPAPAGPSSPARSSRKSRNLTR